MVEAARVMTVSSAHQFSTGNCAASVSLHDAVHLAGFVRQPHEALDEVDVAQRVAGAAGQLAAQVLDLLLKAIGAAHHEDVGGCEEQDQDDQQHAQPPVHQQAERQHDEQGDEGGEVLAEERQPDGEQIVDAGQHDLDQAAGMLGAVERERQQQDVLEEVRHRAQPPAVRHAVGLQGDHDVGGDAAQADDGPQTEQVAWHRSTTSRSTCPWRWPGDRPPCRTARVRRTAGRPPRRW